MADLPTITVTDDQQIRILSAFKAKFGTNTQQQTILAYKRWLTKILRAEVVSYEIAALDKQSEIDKQEAITTIDANKRQAMIEIEASLDLLNPRPPSPEQPPPPVEEPQ